MRNQFLIGGLLAVTSVAIPRIARSQDIESCRLLPGRPDQTFDRSTRTINVGSGACIGGYWQRTRPAIFGSLGEFGATIEITVFAKLTDAKQSVARLPGNTSLKDVKLGDAGLEALEDPRRPDRGVTTAEERASGEEDEESATSLLEATTYHAQFSCGDVAVRVDALPSKGPAARELVKELDAKLRSMGRCGSTAKPKLTRNDPPAPPSSEEGTEPHTRIFSGEIARQLREASNRNARYLVVIDRHWDPQQSCWVEERAFAGGIRGSDADRVSVTVGPSKSFCLNGSVYSADQVNNTQVEIAKARDMLAQARETEQKLDAYLRTHPNDADALNKKRQNQKWIEYYTNAIRAYERSLNGSIP